MRFLLHRRTSRRRPAPAACGRNEFRLRASIDSRADARASWRHAVSATAERTRWRRAAGAAPARGDRAGVDRRRRLAHPAGVRRSRPASTCASASARGRCAAASCPTATRPSSRRSRISPSNEIDLRDGATLERDRPYLVPLIEELRLPDAASGPRPTRRARPAALDVFTRVLTDRNHRFDEIAAGYHGKLYLEVVPRTFAIRVKTGLALNQVRLADGDGRLGDDELLALHEQLPLLFRDEQPLAQSSALARRRAVPQPRRLRAAPTAPSATAPRRTACRSTSRRSARCAGRTTGSPCIPRRSSASCSSPRSSTCCCRPRACASRRPTPPRCSPTTPPPASCARTTPASSTPASATRAQASRGGSRAALEVRARDVSFMVEHGQPVCKLAFERMAEEPDVLYGDGRRLQLPGPADDAEQAFPGAGRATFEHKARTGAFVRIFAIEKGICLLVRNKRPLSALSSVGTKLFMIV